MNKNRLNTSWLIWVLAVLLITCGCTSRFDGSAAEPGQAARPQQTEQATDPSGNASGGIARPGMHTDPPLETLQLGGGLHKYSMDLELDEQGNMLTGSISIDYANPSGKELGNIYFHLYPNTYASEDTAPFFNEEMEKAYPNGFSAGGIEIEQLQVDGKSAEYTLENDDNTLMNLALPQPLPADGHALVELSFTVVLPNSLGRFGYGDAAYNLCNFYPVAAAWNGKDFYKYPYNISGDPFISDVSDYDVRLTVPEGMVVAHTGSGSSSTSAGVTTYTIYAPMVRDFAAVASRQFDCVEQKVDNVTVKSYYYKGMKDAGKTAMRSAADAIKTFGKCYGRYPYDSFSVVQTDFFIGGMEYPGLVLIDESIYDMKVMLEYVVVHETAHQWWYGVVGNDQVKEPWVDEALAEYSTLLYFGENYSEETELTMYDVFVTYNIQYYEEVYGKNCKGVGTPACDFNSSGEYSLCVYLNGCRMFMDIEQSIGRPCMKKVLSVYYENNMYGITNGHTLINTFNKESNQDLTPLFQKWLD